MSLADQGLLSLSNFIINIHLSRILAPKQYGLFAIVFAVYLLLLNFNQALILEPLSIIGMARYRNKLLSYFQKLIGIQFFVSLGVSLVLLLVALYFFYLKNGLCYPFIALVIAGPFICIFFLIRRFCYLLFQPKIALMGTVVYSALLGICYAQLYTNNYINVVSVFLLFGFASLISSLFIMIWIYRKRSNELNGVVRSRIVLFKHWQLGKWLLASSMIGWISSYMYYPLVASLHGLETTAAFKAIDNLLLPMQQAITALCLFIIPKIAGQAKRGHSYLKRVSIKLTIYFTCFVVLYLACLFYFKNEIVHFLYGANSPYVGYLWLLPFVGLTLIVRAVVDLGMGVSLRIVERFDVLFKSSAANSFASLTIGIFLIWKYGVIGAAAGIAIGAGLQLIISSFYFQQIFRVKRGNML
jgi:O-antigen/teichoic acid export membrane protein